MGKLLSIVASLTIITSICGLALGALYEGTRERIALQVLENKQLPAAQRVLPEATNDLLAEHRVLDLGAKNRHVIFHGSREKTGGPYGVAFEVTSSKGFGGNIGVMVGFDLQTGDVLGLFVTTHSETPGVGAKAAADGAFVRQFGGLKQGTPFQVKQDGGTVDAITGATITSRAVCDALNSAVTFYAEHGDEIGALISSDANASNAVNTRNAGGGQ